MIVAAGSARRMGFDKVGAVLAGRPVLEHSLGAFERCGEVGRIVLVADAARVDSEAALREKFPKLTAVVAGGAERALSVLNGLEALGREECFVAVHDAARPLVTPEAISGCFALAREFGGAVCAEPCADTLHRSDDAGRLVETVPRENLWRMQTPQIFSLGELLTACADMTANGEFPTDEAAAMLRAGKTVRVYETPHRNFKLTFPGDFAMAEKILIERE